MVCDMARYDWCGMIDCNMVCCVTSCGVWFDVTEAETGSGEILSHL